MLLPVICKVEQHNFIKIMVIIMSLHVIYQEKKKNEFICGVVQTSDKNPSNESPPKVVFSAESTYGASLQGLKFKKLMVYET